MNTSSPYLTWFRRLALAGAALAFIVIVMGAWVRLSAAGLGCPDWPGCYGHLTAEQASRNLDTVSAAFPERPFEYQKAVKEMLHRYFASTLGFICLVLAGLAIANRKDSQQPVVLPIALVALVIFQGLLGMWTVTLLLKPLIVVLHLLGGLATFSLLAWLAMKPSKTGWGLGGGGWGRNAASDPLPGSNSDLQPPAPSPQPGLAPDLQPPAPSPQPARGSPPLRALALAGLLILILQIALGGWTSSNYAALACPDFPTCQNEWWPEMDAGEAFVLWRGLGTDYEGGVLDHPARVAIHFTHRLGAVVAALMLGLLSVAAWRRGTTPAIRTAGVLLGVVLIVQLILGPLMVMRGLPLSLATAHNGVAALLLLATVRLNWLMRQSQ